MAGASETQGRGRSWGISQTWCGVLGSRRRASGALPWAPVNLASGPRCRMAPASQSKTGCGGSGALGGPEWAALLLCPHVVDGGHKCPVQAGSLPSEADVQGGGSRRQLQDDRW